MLLFFLAVDDKSVQAHLNPKQNRANAPSRLTNCITLVDFFSVCSSSENDLDTLANHEHLIFFFTYLVSRE